MILSRSPLSRAFAGFAPPTLLLTLALVAQFKPASFARTLRQIVGVGPPAVDSGETYRDAAGTATFDHSTFDQLLQEYVRDGGWVDYAGLATNSDLLDAYLDELALAPFAGNTSQPGRLPKQH